jgi:hypothetical protein
VKISAQEIVDNLHFPNGTAMIPPGAMVYISTDDPDGLCKNCLVNRLPCNTYKTPKPPGCPEDVSFVLVNVQVSYFCAALWGSRFGELLALVSVYYCQWGGVCRAHSHAVNFARLNPH